VVTYKRGGRVKSMGLGTHHLAKGKSARMAGGLEPPKNPTRGRGNEAPHHPKKGLGPIDHAQHGQMGPDYNVGAGGGGARLRKRERAPKFVNRVP
jgi:hypothetical protein